MKKLATLVAVVSLSIAAPVFACPGHSEASDEAPRTAEKDKTEKTDKTAKNDKTEKSDKTAEKTKTEKAPTKTDGTKKPDKVSSK